MAHAIRFIAVLLMALALVPGAAHLFVLPNKLALDRDAYFTVQQIYAGWALFGAVLFAALAADAALAWSLRRDRRAATFAAAGLLAIVATLAIFLAWTFPANQATANWTTIPPDWEGLRWQWEFSHAANAIITFAGFSCVVWAAISAPDGSARASGELHAVQARDMV